MEQDQASDRVWKKNTSRAVKLRMRWDLRCEEWNYLNWQKSSFPDSNSSSHKERQSTGCEKQQRSESKMLMLQPPAYDLSGCHSSSVRLPLRIWGMPEQQLPVKINLPPFVFLYQEIVMTQQSIFSLQRILSPYLKNICSGNHNGFIFCTR